MRITDIVNQLRAVFPKYSDVLADVVPVLPSPTAITSTGSAITVTTSSPHGLSPNDPVVIQNVSYQNVLTSIVTGQSVGMPDIPYVVQVAVDHDLTPGWHSEVEFSGFGVVPPEFFWNGKHELLDVIDRKTFGISLETPAPIPALTGDQVAWELRRDGVNGYRKVVTVPTDTTFVMSFPCLAGNYVTGTISANIRIAGAVDIERAIEEYTKQDLTDVWAFVVPNDVDVSKDMYTSSDATATRMAGSEEFRLRVIDGFTLYLIKSTKQDIGGVEAVDLFRHDLVLPILKSICGVKFPMGLTTGPDFRTVLRGHGVAQYNRAFLVYAYDFEQPADIVNTDTAYDDDTAAFRELDYIHRVGGDDTEDATAHVEMTDY